MRSVYCRLWTCCSILLLTASAPLTVYGQTAKGGNLVVRTNDGRKHFTLSAEAVWQLNPPRNERFDASGLAFREGKLLTVNDRTPELYEIGFRTDGTADLNPTQIFSKEAVRRASAHAGQRFDVEGIALDSSGNLYICEESQRALFRFSPETGSTEMLKIDWSPVKKYFSKDSNSSFEGIAVSDDRIYVANERNSPRIIVVDRREFKVVDSFFVDSENFAFGGPHYSGLVFRDDRLFVLDRNHRAIFEVDPAAKRVLAEYSFGQMELQENVAYKTRFPTGTMEGLAMDETHFWLVTDNNGEARFKFPGDIRPTLFKCKRPQ